MSAVDHHDHRLHHVDNARQVFCLDPVNVLEVKRRQKVPYKYNYANKIRKYDVKNNDKKRPPKLSKISRNFHRNDKNIPEEEKQCWQGKEYFNLRSLVKAAEDTYDEYRLKAKINCQYNCLNSHEAWKLTMYDVTDGKVTDWLAGNTQRRARTVLPQVRPNKEENASSYGDSRAAIANTDCSVYNFIK